MHTCVHGRVSAPNISTRAFPNVFVLVFVCEIVFVFVFVYIICAPVHVEEWVPPISHQRHFQVTPQLFAPVGRRPLVKTPSFVPRQVHCTILATQSKYETLHICAVSQKEKETGVLHAFMFRNTSTFCFLGVIFHVHPHLPVKHLNCKKTQIWCMQNYTKYGTPSQGKRKEAASTDNWGGLFQRRYSTIVVDQVTVESLVELKKSFTDQFTEVMTTTK